MSARTGPPTRPLVFLIAGEPSGDALGAKLMAALKIQVAAAGGSIEFAGVGGERMAAEGMHSLFPLADIAVMGLTEVLPRLPVILRRIDHTVAAVLALRPAAVVTIDAPSFCFRVAAKVRRKGIPVVHYVAPQLWAWRPDRARKLVGRVDHLLALFPFEPAFFRKVGVACSYVGHPVLEDAASPGNGARFRAQHGIGLETPLLIVLPGSRAGVVRRMLPIFAAAVARLRSQLANLAVVIPTVAGTHDHVAVVVSKWGTPATLVRDPETKRDAYAAATAALTVSGTATMELAVAGLPMVVAYRVSRMSAFFARRLIEVRHIAMPNLILERTLVPELVQEDCTPSRLAEAVAMLLRDPAQRAAQQGGLAEVCARLGRDGPSPSSRAARIILDLVATRHPAAAGS
ncbi:MAG: lipid-A-disaccharide synthase [Proteobacteria bacterium]|nr:lipid-A-disaccharide synthase [Pseudomonadota bacterium]